MRNTLQIGMLILVLLLVSCRPAAPVPRTTTSLDVVATLPFLADVAQNVAGDRLRVSSLLPAGVDPHSYEPTPADVAKVADSEVLIINGAGLEAFLERLLRSVGGERVVIEASTGLVSRTPHEGEVLEGEAHGHEHDPHFWLDPNLVIRYVENIRDGLSQVDPEGAAVYAANAAAYVTQLKELDAWIAEQIAQIPPQRRLLVTNHESFGYFADRYGLRIVGTVIPSVSTGASPSARQLARLVDAIKASGAPAIFLETGSNPQLAQQLARETGVKIVTNLYTHSLGAAGGSPSSYIEMMRHNTRVIVDGLKGEE
nr:zinc ABC transporter substrate-binding protein [Chloroflexota bacterium]